ncbi:hypothetical protein P2G88_18835 [Aliiglaciecola sp. CAU 1673]|uniref:hypothetical protein n=1 Tax=Aliiglaciecola sp. CAU 1673 TaxID=3032595 RepID=UPI0023D9EB67|nr:hypothetical protein [Aliiglaciecola sp. CAU 1673]MDF2180318.1 hypothetical protein [Aliiglaciecola sp. CAU 1673]
MLKKITIATTLLFAGTLSANVQAEQVSLKEYVSYMLKAAVSVTQQEMQKGVEQAVVEAGQAFILDSANTVELAEKESDAVILAKAE